MPKKNSLLSTICTFVVVSLLLFAFSRFLKLPLKADDTEGPEIVAWAITPDSINSDDAEVDITLYARIKAEKGVTPFTTSSFVAENAEGKSITFRLALMTEVEEHVCIGIPHGFNVDGLSGCGDEFDGIYSASMKLPQYSIDGIWLSSGDIKDNEGNILRFEDLEEKDRPYFTNNATNSDITPPVIKSLVVDKTSFDTSEGPATITITMELEDDLSGIDTRRSKSHFYISPVLEWNSRKESSDLLLVNAQDGIYTTEITLPINSKPGFWSFTEGVIYDLAGNGTDISENISEYIGEKYLANTAISDEVTIADSWWLEGGYLSSVSYDGTTKVTSSWPSVVIIFQEGTIVTKQGGGNFGIHRMVSESYITEKYKTLAELLTEANEKLETDIKKCHESEGCVAEELTGSDLVGNPINIGKVGLPGLGLSFSKPATIILAVDEKYLGQTLEVQTFDGTKWVKIGSCLVKTFDPLDPSAGADPEGEYKSVSYPGCSFTTDHASFFSANVLGAETETEKEVEKEVEKLPGVPNTGLGGTSSILYKYIGWIR